MVGKPRKEKAQKINFMCSYDYRRDPKKIA